MRSSWRTALSLQSLGQLPTLDLQAPLLPLLSPTSSTFNLKTLNLQPLLSFLGPTLNLHAALNLQPLLPFIGPTLNLQPIQLAQLHPPTLHLHPLLLPTQFLLQS